MDGTLVPVCALQGHTDRVWQVAWSPDGRTLASCSADKTVRLWTAGVDSSVWTCAGVLDGAHERTIRTLAWSPCGKFLACGSFDSTISLWQKSGAEWTCGVTLEGHENEVKGVAWAASGSLLASASRDKSVWIWSVEESEDFECVAVLTEHAQDVKTLAWHPTAELLASAGYDDTIKLWADSDNDDWFCCATLTGHTSTVWNIAFDSSGKNLVSCSDDLDLIIWHNENVNDHKGWRRLTTLGGHHPRTVYSVDWSKQGCLATGAGDDAIRVFSEVPPAVAGDLPSWQLTACVRNAHAGDVNCVKWNPEMPGILASAGDDNLVKLWRCAAS